MEYTIANKTKCLGYPVYTGDLNTYKYENKTFINTINQYSYCVAEKDNEFKKSLMNSDILLPDGIGICAASKFLDNQNMSKFSGYDLHEHLVKKANEESGKIFYLGSSEKVLNKIEARLKKDYPHVEVKTYSPPYKTQFSTEDNEAMLEAINSFKPDVLFVGMTAPKQEKWTDQNRAKLDAGIICAIGAVFDFYAGTVERPSKIWIDLGLEWLGRLVKEPKRMWKRYIYYGGVFAYYLVKEKAQRLTGQKKVDYRFGLKQ